MGMGKEVLLKLGVRRAGFSAVRPRKRGRPAHRTPASVLHRVFAASKADFADSAPRLPLFLTVHRRPTVRAAPLGFRSPMPYRSHCGRHHLAVISSTHEVERIPMAKAKKSARKPAKKPARRAAPKAPQSIKTVLTKSALVAHLAEAAQVAAKDARALLAALENAILASIGRKSAGTVMLPGLLKITVTSVAARPARKGVNPFTGEPTTFKARPATVKVKVRAMKKLKDAAKA